MRSRRMLNGRSAVTSYWLCKALQFARPAKGADLNVERFLYAREKVLAAPVPKVASRTIKDLFVSLNEPDQDFEKLCEPSEIRSLYPDYFVFSFVRNPWARVHSCWKDKIADAVTPGKILILSRFNNLRPFMPFEEFAEWLDSEDGRDEVADRHWLSQTRHLSDKEGTAICDYVGQMEALEDGLAEVARITGIRLPAVRKLNVKGSRSDYCSAYSERSRRLIERRYGEDIETFRYQFS